ncbi:MAG: plasmid stabilization system [Flavipsychrobacter sp.]|jgi:addiction module RelE/StbE family toxin|nr:plasmid stabilization system [Flavipsychrobacter sp.]
MAKVSLSPAALDDLKAIFEFISNDSEFYAEKVINNILQRITVLETHTRIGKVVPEFRNDSIREIREASYRIIYRIESEVEISVARVYHGARLLKEL